MSAIGSRPEDIQHRQLFRKVPETDIVATLSNICLSPVFGDHFAIELLQRTCVDKTTGCGFCVLRGVLGISEVSRYNSSFL